MAKSAKPAKPVSTSGKTSQWVYFFGGGKADGTGGMKDLLGGKGAGLAEMSKAGVPVPPGFTITTEVCNRYYSDGPKVVDQVFPMALAAMARVEKLMGRKFGDPANPLLVSVRSGAKFSMPGMMDTILNLGLNDETVQGLIKVSNNPVFGWDCYRRFIQMFSNVVLEIDHHHFEHELNKLKQKQGFTADNELGAADWQKVVGLYKALVRKTIKKDFPQDAREQLRLAVTAVFKSWNNDRALIYRRMNDIPHDLGTAVNVQAMVFGNLNDKSGTGVGFTRDPATGEKVFYGEFLIKAQGEDVVAGIRTAEPIAKLKTVLPQAYKQLQDITTRLEKHYRDLQDFEFTIEDGRLFMLQTRNGKRTGFAAIKAAVDMVSEKLIDKKEAIRRMEPQFLDQLLHPVFDPQSRKSHTVLARGLPASPGAASGHIVFTSAEAVKWKHHKKDVILVRQETSPDDIEGMYAAKGVLTLTGGMTSHAAVVGRQMGLPSVVGCGSARLDEKKKLLMVGGQTLKEGEWLSIDGTTGEVLAGHVRTIPSEVVQVVMGKLKPSQSALYQQFNQIMLWADEIRRLKVRTNADTPEDAALAVAFGAEGIGLCRTEHMFFDPVRVPIMQAMILAESREDREKFLAKLEPMQEDDFLGIFKAMDGRPVTIRLLDPPLHEFLPKREELMLEIQRLELKGASEASLKKKKRLLDRVQQLHEFNPMLGLRGCRLSLLMPEITEMQVKAILGAAIRLEKQGKKVVPEIMVPLTGHVNEMKEMKKLIDGAAKESFERTGQKVRYLVGTMIEIPRAAITAHELAHYAEFFSFGTNDLTQMTFGFSRDDAGKIIRHYTDNDIFRHDPFETIDQDGVGEFIRIARDKGKSTRKNLKLGICGEHGGEDKSVAFCHRAGLDYVSCSPYRVPLARLSAARAAL